MIKAVTLNKVEHAHLIKFITGYVDESGRNNISSGIRYLMEKGFECIQNEQEQNDIDTEDLKAAITNDLKEALKQELKSEITSELNTTVLDNLSTAIDKLGNIQTVPVQAAPAQVVAVQPEQNKQTEQNIPVRKRKPLPNNVPVDSLLANLLANSDK